MAKFDWIEDPEKIASSGMTSPFYHVVHDFVLVKSENG